MANLFDSAWYLHRNPDVAVAVGFGLTDAATHHQDHGRFEGRSPSHLFDPAHYLAHNADVSAAVEAGLVTAYDHFLLHGMAEGRSFLPYFDAQFYLRYNPDIDAAVGGSIEAAVAHFLQHGQTEARPVLPVFDMGAYLRANPDVAAMVEQTGGNPVQHLLFHGHDESRPLGNGIHLDQFAYDIVFQTAKTPFEKLARIAEVGPFLPSFNPPPGWEAPEDTPIPIDFIPIPGEKLVVPPSVKIPDGMELPDTFEPVNPDPGPGPGPGPGPKPDPEPGEFEAYFDESAGVVKFLNVQGKEVEFKSIEADLDGDDDSTAILLEFESGEQTSIARLPMDCGCIADWLEEEFGVDDLELGLDADPDIDPFLEALEDLTGLLPYIRIELQKDETLVAVPELLFLTVVNKVQVFGASITGPDSGSVSVRADMGAGDLATAVHLSFEDTAAFVLGHQEDGTEELHLKMEDSFIVLGPHADYNLLTYGKEYGGVRLPKSLAIETTGQANFLDLGNDDVYRIGYDLGDVDLSGEGLFFLFSLYLDETVTDFNASEHEGSIVLSSYVDTDYEAGSPDDGSWSVRLGEGNDALLLSALGGGTGKTGGVLDGGDGRNLLELDAELYELWKDIDPDEGPKIQHFQILFTEAIDDTKYQSTLLGNNFDTLSIHSDERDSSISVEVAEGFSRVEIGGSMTVDASALKEAGAQIYIEHEYASAVTIKVAELDPDTGAKPELPEMSDIKIVLPDWADMELVELTVENMTISYTGSSSDVAPHDTIDFSAWRLADRSAFEAMVDTFTVSDATVGATSYKTFEIGFDFNNDLLVDFALILKNVVTQAEYNEMVSGGGDEMTELLEILISEGTFILSGEAYDDTFAGIDVDAAWQSLFEDFFMI